MILFYQILDIMATLSEAITMYTAARCLCNNEFSQFEQKWRRYLPPALFLILIFFFTWYTELGVLKIPLGTMFYFLLVLFFYKAAPLKAAIASSIGSILLMITDSLGASVTYLFFGAEEFTVTINGLLLLSWKVYILGTTIRYILIYIFWKLFKNFSCRLDWKALLLILFDYFLMSWISAISTAELYAGNQNYFILANHLFLPALGISILISVLYLKNYFFLQSQAKQDRLQLEYLETQYAYYQDKLREEEKVRSIYHDLKNHLLILQSQSTDSLEIRQSLANLQTQIADFENFYRTGNDFLDVIIHDKAKAAQTQQIDFTVTVEFKDGSFIAPLDISTIFGNALDNALEASEKLPVEKRLISLKASRIHDMIVIVVENNADFASLSGNKTTKSDSFLHGFGLRNIQKAVEKYQGECITSTENNYFSLKIL